MGNVIVLGIVAVLAGAAVRSIVRAKKRGAGCIGCPSADACHRACQKDEEK